MMYHCLAIDTRRPQCLKILNRRLTIQLTVLSTPKKKMPKKATATMTTKVVTTTSCWLGQVTWRSSTRTSCRNSPHCLGCCLIRSHSAPVRDSGASPDIAFNRSACNAIALQFPTSFIRTFGLAGEEGFEPPHPVLETGGLPLNLLPFTLNSRVSGCEGFTLMSHPIAARSPSLIFCRPFDPLRVSQGKPAVYLFKLFASTHSTPPCGSIRAEP